jgi:demethylmenaquinone methyltransferase/2-methoxy-6-polyprenyl-1,4-benzoquinol methylase
VRPDAGQRSSPRPGSLRAAFRTADTKRRHVRALFETIAGRYDFITRFLSFGQDQRWKRQLMDLAGVRTGSRVLDLACGTGDLALLARARGAGRTVGVDVAWPMLKLAQAKPGGDAIAWLLGDMEQLPIARHSFDVVTTGYGLRNVSALDRALAEIYRALAPGGAVCSLDFERPDAPWLRAIYLSYLTVVGSVVGWALHGDPDTYRYIPASIRRYPGAKAVAGLMRAAGFSDVRHVPLLFGLMAIHVGRK